MHQRLIQQKIWKSHPYSGQGVYGRRNAPMVAVAHTTHAAIKSLKLFQQYRRELRWVNAFVLAFNILL